MIAKALTKTAAEEWLSAKREGKAGTTVPHEIGAPPRGELDNQIEALLEELEELIEIASEKPIGIQPSFFDSKASELVHRSLREIPIQISADRDFWRYLSCGPLFEVVEWRHHKSDNLDNFGLGKLWESLPERLWFRGHVSVMPDHQDPYQLTRRGTVDFWASGPIRHLFGCNHSLVRALARFQYPGEGSFTGTGQYRPQTLSMDGIREVFIRLRHFHATVELETLSEDDAAALIDDLSVGIAREEDETDPEDLS